MIKVQLVQRSSTGDDLMKRNIPSVHMVPPSMCMCIFVRGMQCGQADKGDDGALIKDGAC